jgi:hypothetical protein
MRPSATSFGYALIHFRAASRASGRSNHAYATAHAFPEYAVHSPIAGASIVTIASARSVARRRVRLVGTRREREPQHDPTLREPTIALGLFVPATRELAHLVDAERRRERGVTRRTPTRNFL